MLIFVHHFAPFLERYFMCSQTKMISLSSVWIKTIVNKHIFISLFHFKSKAICSEQTQASSMQFQTEFKKVKSNLLFSISLVDKIALPADGKQDTSRNRVRWNVLCKFGFIYFRWFPAWVVRDGYKCFCCVCLVFN